MILKKGRGEHSKYLSYAFTEQGVAMLSGVLNSRKAISMNIAIMRAFVEIRRLIMQRNDIREIMLRISQHDAQLSEIYDAIENLLDKIRHKENGMKEKELALKNNII